MPSDDNSDLSKSHDLPLPAKSTPTAPQRYTTCEGAPKEGRDLDGMDTVTAEPAHQIMVFTQLADGTFYFIAQCGERGTTEAMPLVPDHPDDWCLWCQFHEQAWE